MDDGVTWVPANTGLTDQGVYSFAIENSELFTCTLTDYGGVFGSTDNGNTWTLTGLNGTQIYCLAANDSFLCVSSITFKK